MLKIFRKDSLTPQTERIYKVPLCIQYNGSVVKTKI